MDIQSIVEARQNEIKKKVWFKRLNDSDQEVALQNIHTIVYLTVKDHIEFIKDKISE